MSVAVGVLVFLGPPGLSRGEVSYHIYIVASCGESPKLDVLRGAPCSNRVETYEYAVFSSFLHPSSKPS